MFNRSPSRRAFLQQSSLVLTGAACFPSGLLHAEDRSPMLRVGMMTDLHYADKDPAGSRYYRETLAKLADASEKLGEAKLDFLVELGDFIDAADSVETEQSYLKTIAQPFAEICDDRHYVLGNHCVDTLTKQEFLGGVGQEKSFYSFDRGEMHFVVLDACFTSAGEPYGRKNFVWTDANIPPEELEWLTADLAATKKKTIVFAHQRLDQEGKHAVKNAAAVRKVLQKSGNVWAVFQGHSHANDYREVAGIHYCTMRAMIEKSGVANNGFAVLEIDPRGVLKVNGFRDQADYQWS
ncbi:alkaline phosphatase [Bremerella cremea]|uniref:Alkaline phosphatase n=1 Tax=Bremerella cremea TaxID=1031537 RepID=A0A368KS37_9BACT|nr:metallophosphoesterase [Bremerella cremea]RCS50656.1 alkaline phosphatase [Bremerella cremea]